MQALPFTFRRAGADVGSVSVVVIGEADGTGTSSERSSAGSRSPSRHDHQPQRL